MRLRAMIKSIFSPTAIVGWLCLTAMIGFSGPFGTYDSMQLWARLGIWAAVVFGGIVIGQGVRHLIWHLLPKRGYWEISVISSAALTVSLSVPLYFILQALNGPAATRVPPMPELGIIVFSLGLGLSALRLLLTRPGKVPQGPRLLQRLEPELRGELIRCTVSDHYVRVITERGEGRLLMRFADALSELDDADGLRVHRSHWIARDAVTAHANENGRLVILSKDGARIPVSRNYRPEVEAALSA